MKVDTNLNFEEEVDAARKSSRAHPKNKPKKSCGFESRLRYFAVKGLASAGTSNIYVVFKKCTTKGWYDVVTA